MKTITANERMQLIGLLTLSQRHDRQMKQIELAALEITEEEGISGHTSDFVWWATPNTEDPVTETDKLLERLGITVDG